MVPETENKGWEDEVIVRMKEILKDGKISRKTLYETLLQQGFVKPGSEKMIYEILDYAIEDGVIPRTRLKVYRKNRGRLPIVFSKEQLVTIFDRCQNPKLAIVMWLGFFCAMRVSEACKLKVSDIDLVKNKVFISDAKNRFRSRDGGGKQRYVSIPEVALGPIKKWLDVVDGGKWLIPSMSSCNKPIRTKTVHEQIRNHFNQCGLDEVIRETRYQQRIRGKLKQIVRRTYKYSYHKFRSTYATYLLEHDVPLENVKRILGHERIDTTLVYTKISDTRTKNFINDAFSESKSIPNRSIPQGQNQSKESNIDKLKARLVNGEIDLDTYKQIKYELI